MVPMIEAIEGCSLPCFPLMGLFFKDTFLEMHMHCTHFHGGKEYLDILPVRVLKEVDNFFVEQFCTLVKTYLAFQSESVIVELDAHEVCYHIDIQED